MRPDIYTIHPRHRRRHKTFHTWWRENSTEILSTLVWLWYILTFSMCLRRMWHTGTLGGELILLAVPPLVYWFIISAQAWPEALKQADANDTKHRKEDQNR